MDNNDDDLRLAQTVGLERVNKYRGKSRFLPGSKDVPQPEKAPLSEEPPAVVEQAPVNEEVK
jgi:hypothetical protein